MADLFSCAKTRPPFPFPRGEGYHSVWSETLNGYDITLPGGRLLYVEQFFNQAWSDRIVAFLQEGLDYDWRSIDWRKVEPEQLKDFRFSNIAWKQDSMKLYGKHIPLPRLTAWYGDKGAAYTYSGIKSDPNPWNDGLLHIKARIEDAVGEQFNCVLLNWYRDGKDSLSWHADDESELGPSPTIASANFGATRDFLLRRNSNHEEKLSIPLVHGSLVVMCGHLQENWKHAVPKRANVGKSRFNLTFRNIRL